MPKTVKLLFIVLLFVIHSGVSQTNNSAGSSQSASSKYNSGSTNNLVLNLNQDTCLDKKFSIIFYLINDSAYSLTNPASSATAIAAYSLSAMINVLNTAFKPICVQFEHCKTVIIPDYELNQWKISTTQPEIFRKYYEKNVINIYIPYGILPPHPDFPEELYTFPLPPVPQGTFVTTDAIVMPKGAALEPMTPPGFVGSSLLHVFGHYFGLPHTYFEKDPGNVPSPPPPNNATPPIATLEYVDHASIQNCLDHGDGFCDTEADPYPSVLNGSGFQNPQPKNCGNAGGLKDGHGDYYVIPDDNFMSHYICRCKFTPQQYRYMAYIILTRRMYLH